MILDVIVKAQIDDVSGTVRFSSASSKDSDWKTRVGELFLDADSISAGL